MRLSLAVAASIALLTSCADQIPGPTPIHPVDRAADATGPLLVINEFLADPNAVGDDVGEWFEVHNAGGASANLLNYTIASNNDASVTITSSVTVAAGGYVVLARNVNKKKNGGVTAQFQYGTGITLANASDWLVLRDASGVTVDSVSWTSTTAGTAWGVKDPTSDNAAVGAGNWQLQTSVFGKGDKGTPGARNDGYAPPPGAVASVVVSPASASIAVSSTQPFSAQGYDANGTPVATTFTWASSNAAVATVNASGLATGVAAGSATITATSANGIAGSAALTVTSGGGGGGASELVVRVLDVGQGDANYIQNGTSKIIFDGGPDMTRFGVLLDSLGLNNTTIDVVILSHPHFDHHSGLRELFRTSRNITVSYFFESKDVYSNAALAELRDSVTARAQRGQLIYRDTDDPCANGQPICTVTMNGGAKLHILRPNPAGSTPNNRSTSAKLVGPDSASFSMFFAGDAEHEAISWFLGAAGYATNPGLRVTVQKSNHHGSCNGVTNAYADALNPDWVTMSLGATNTYGHIHEQTKDLWSARGKPWYRTDVNGTITFRSPGTPGGGYTVSVQKGLSSMNGAPDGTSGQAQCNPIP